MKNILKLLRIILVSVLIFQCCAGFTVFKVLRDKHIHKYIHSKDCQLKNYLALDCFNHCNGIQSNSEESQKKDKSIDDNNLLSQINAILVSTQKINSKKVIIVPHGIYRDVNVLTGTANKIFQPPKVV